MGKPAGLSIVFFLAFVLSVSIFMPVSLSFQPPIDTGTFYEGKSAWGPYDADPAVAYDTESGELIFNTYQELIAWNGEKYYDFVPVLATNVPVRQDVTTTVTNTSEVNTGAR
jgi:peptide/nickel transport system substrate-binding protein